MIAQKLITAAAENNIVLIPSEKDLHISFKGQPDTALLDMIALHKMDIIGALKARSYRNSFNGSGNGSGPQQRKEF
jgi:hypothetical protein